MSEGIGVDDWNRIDSIPGWLSFPAADLAYRLIRTDLFKDVPGAAVELGVFKGKFLSLIACATLPQKRPIIGIDGFFAGFDVPLEDAWVEPATQEMIRNVRIGDPSSNLTIHRYNSSELTPRTFHKITGGAVAFLSIDAGHEAHEVYNDFRISYSTLVNGSILAADDVFNPVVPGVAEGVCRFLGSSEGRGLAPFATCGNKLFLTKTASHADYVNICRDIVMGEPAAYLAKSKTHMQRNNKIGHCPKMFGFEVVPFAV